MGGRIFSAYRAWLRKTRPNQIPPSLVAFDALIMTNNIKKKKLTEAEKEAYALVGRHGGRATFKKHGREYMSKIGQIGAKKRWAKQKSSKKI